MQSQQLLFLIGILGFWQLAVTILLFAVSRKLTGIRKTEKAAIPATDLRTLAARINDLERASVNQINHVGLVRFNPFQNEGGDQSFSLALLDKKTNGVVITSLHSRTSTRTYAKLIVGGKSRNAELSEEEIKAVAESIG